MSTVFKLLRGFGCWRAEADLAVCGQGSVARIGQCAGVLLRGRDLAMTEPVLDDDDVGAAGQQPGCVSGAQVMKRHRLRDLRGLYRRHPELGAEVVPRQGRPSL